MIPSTLLLITLVVQDSTAECKQLVSEYVRADWAGEGEKLAAMHDEETLRDIGGSILVLAKLQLRAGNSEFAYAIFPDEPSVSELEKMSRADALAAYFKMLRRTASELGIKFSGMKLVGAILESENVCHVVYRETTQHGDHTESEALMLTCVKEDRKWKIKLPLIKWENYRRYFQYAALTKTSDEPSDQPKSR